MSGRPLLPALPFRELVLRAQANATGEEREVEFRNGRGPSGRFPVARTGRKHLARLYAERFDTTEQAALRMLDRICAGEVARLTVPVADQLATFFHRHLCELVGDIPPLEEPA